MQLQIEKKATNILWCVLLFLILCFPRILQTEKIILCLMTFVSSFLYEKRISVTRIMNSFLLPWFVYALLAIIVGVVRQNVSEGIIAFLRVNILNCLIYVAVLCAVRSRSSLKFTINTITASAFYIGLFNIIIALGSYLGIDTSALRNLDATANVGIHVGYSHIVSTNLSMSIIIFPILLFSGRIAKVDTITKKKIRNIALILCGLAMILSGRRIIWGVILFCLIVFFFTAKNLKKRFRYLIVGLLLLVGVLVISDKYNIFSLTGIYNRFLTAFSNIDEYGQANVRNTQGEILLRGFWEKPVLGNGAGAVVDGYIRSADRPWAYELSYHSTLFQSGIIGGTFYLLALGSIFLNIHRIRKTDKEMWHMILITFACAIISNATNPYFSSSFDFLIFIFLPLFLCEVYTIYMQPNNSESIT